METLLRIPHRTVPQAGPLPHFDPGAGGITRTVRMFGLQDALTKLILSGIKYGADDAKQLGLIDDVVDTVEELHEKAGEWIRANPNPVKPWDVKGFRIPGGSPNSPSIAGLLAAMPATLRKQTKGAPLQAPRAAMAAAVEGGLPAFVTRARELAASYGPHFEPPTSPVTMAHAGSRSPSSRRKCNTSRVWMFSTHREGLHFLDRTLPTFDAR